MDYLEEAYKLLEDKLFHFKYGCGAITKEEKDMVRNIFELGRASKEKEIQEKHLPEFWRNLEDSAEYMVVSIQKHTREKCSYVYFEPGARLKKLYQEDFWLHNSKLIFRADLEDNCCITDKGDDVIFIYKVK